VIEAELKTQVHAPQDVIRNLEQYGPGHVETYHDTYYDDAEGRLTARDAELRTRTVSSPHDTRFVLTYKGATLDADSGSKPEHETRVTDPDAVQAMLSGLGYRPVISFEKRCRNYEFDVRGRTMLATLAFLPELEATFLELETLLPADGDLPAALEDVRAVLHDLGIKDADFTRERYTEAVAAKRRD
jgi:adenylate cyclase, class 2